MLPIITMICAKPIWLLDHSYWNSSKPFTSILLGLAASRCWSTSSAVEFNLCPPCYLPTVPGGAAGSGTWNFCISREWQQAEGITLPLRGQWQCALVHRLGEMAIKQQSVDAVWHCHLGQAPLWALLCPREFITALLHWKCPQALLVRMQLKPLPWGTEVLQRSFSPSPGQFEVWLPC